jgi:tRNA(Ile)-lysidine synthase
MVVAVSGGPDSVALLRALIDLGGTPLCVAHLNHRLRGPESDADEEFVRDLYARLVGAAAGLSLRCERIEVAARAGRDNLEGAARRVRYEWLAGVAREAGLGRVATGHTADDQAETVLHRLLRGAGLKGLRGIAARRELGSGVEVVRPLLAVRRAEVLAYLDGLGQPYRQDSSNRDLTRTRNRIRADLLPLLAEQYNPEVVAVLGRLAGQAGDAYAAEEGAARALLAAAERPRAGAVVVLDREALAAAGPRLREAFRLLWEREGWPTGEMGFDAWERVAAVARGECTAAELPGGVHVRCRERVVQVERRQ